MAGGTGDIRAMHYDFKQKLNKIDSQQYRNLKVPEIDWKLNEGLYTFIKRIAQPRTNISMGFERDTRSIDDIRTLIIEDSSITTSAVRGTIVRGALPSNYLFYVSSQCVAAKDDCSIEIPISIQKHTREFINDRFLQSSFEWRQVNALFVGNYLHIYAGDDFNVSTLLLSYIKKPAYMHNAQDAAGGKYKMLDGTELTGKQNCELPELLHGEIVDLAVLITTGDLISDYQAKFSKIQLVEN